MRPHHWPLFRPGRKALRPAVVFWILAALAAAAFAIPHVGRGYPVLSLSGAMETFFGGRPAAAHEHSGEDSWQPKWLDPLPAPNFHLRDQNGRAVRLSDFQGKVVLIHFLYTKCQTNCSLLTRELSQVQRRISPSLAPEVVFLSITLDPRRDTPAVLRAYGRNLGADFTRWKFLTGSPSQIETVLGAYEVFHERDKTPAGEITHSNPIFLVDQWSRVRKKMGPALFTQRGEEYIRQLVREGNGRH